MNAHPLAGTLAPKTILVNVPRLVSAYYIQRPDVKAPEQRVAFGTSGHRGSSFKCSFNEAHVLAITQAIYQYRKQQGIDGPLFLGMDTHALSEPARATALEVLAANGVTVMIDQDLGYTPTPVISHAIITHNRGRKSGLADGIVITPSHNPPEDGGLKYNPPHGGPANTEVTSAIQKTANALLESKSPSIKRIPYKSALRSPNVRRHDFISPYIADLDQVIDMQTVQQAGLKIGVDPMGGSGLAFWKPLAERYGIKLEVVNDSLDPTFSFMTLDWDGRIRMDCSSPFAMARLITMKDRFDVAFGNDTDFDRHGIVTPTAGLINPNHYLAVAIWHLFQNRPDWKTHPAVGKTLVSSSIIDRVAAHLNCKLVELPVGFKWFVDGLLEGSLGFAGEESAGASFLRRDGTVWTTDKDGIILDLLAAEITAHTGKDPGMIYNELTAQFGAPVYERIDAPATPKQKSALKKLSATQVKAHELAGEKIVAKLTQAPGNGAPIDGIKVVATNGWFAARPSGTEDVYKIYAESFRGKEHLARIQEEAQAIVSAAIANA